MKRTLVIATTSYAGMGPYVSEIVNLFSAKDNIFYFFQDYEDGFFRKNIKEELYPKSCFFKKNNRHFHFDQTRLYNRINDFVYYSIHFVS